MPVVTVLFGFFTKEVVLPQYSGLRFVHRRALGTRDGNPGKQTPLLGLHGGLQVIFIVSFMRFCIKHVSKASMHACCLMLYVHKTLT